MAATLKDIKRRIRSVKNAQQITKAMEMVAAARLRRYQQRLAHLRQIEAVQLESFRAVRPEKFEHPLCRQPEGDEESLVVFSSDRGLCGAYNSNIARRGLRYLSGRDDVRGRTISEINCIGRKFFQALKRTPYREAASLVELSARADAKEIGGVLDRLCASFLEQPRRTTVIYTFPLSISKQEIRVEPLLPAVLPEPKEAKFLVEPDAFTLSLLLFHELMRTRFYRTYLETQVAEQASRMLAMQAAGKNAVELEGKLTLAYNKARQAAITKEILEVVSGAEALKH